VKSHCVRPRDIHMERGRITTANRRTITLSPTDRRLAAASCVRPAARPVDPRPVVDRPTDGSTCCDRVVDEIDVVCCQMRRKWHARIEENCPRSVGPTMLLLLLLVVLVMRYAEPDDGRSHAERETDRQLMQLARPADNHPHCTVN